MDAKAGLQAIWWRFAAQVLWRGDGQRYNFARRLIPRSWSMAINFGGYPKTARPLTGIDQIAIHFPEMAVTSASGVSRF